MIAFDLDGVLCDLYSFIREIFLDEFNFDLFIDFNEEINIPGYNKIETNEIILDIVRTRSSESKIYDNVLEPLTNFYILTGEPIKIITARQIDARKQTIMWLKKYMPDIKFKIYFCGNSNNKLKYLKDVKFYVEDQMDNSVKFSPFLDCIFLINRSWNKNNNNAKDNIIRVEDLDEVFDMFKLFYENRYFVNEIVNF